MILRWCGLLIIFLCFVWIGWKISGEYRLQIRQMKEYECFLIRLKHEMLYGKRPLNFALESSAKCKLHSELYNVMHQVSQKLSDYAGDQLSDIYRSECKSLENANGLYLEKDDLELIYTLGDVLSNHDYSMGRFDQLDLHMKYVDEHCKNLEQQIPIKQKLARNLWTCVGAAVVLLIW